MRVLGALVALMLLLKRYNMLDLRVHVFISVLKIAKRGNEREPLTGLIRNPTRGEESA